MSRLDFFNSVQRNIKGCLDNRTLRRYHQNPLILMVECWTDSRRLAHDNSVAMTENSSYRIASIPRLCRPRYNLLNNEIFRSQGADFNGRASIFLDPLNKLLFSVVQDVRD